MKVEVAELVFIQENAPTNFSQLIADNVGLHRSTVNNELNRLKKRGDYNDAIITEARRLLKAIKGLEYTPKCVA